MTDFSGLVAADRGQTATPLHLVDKKRFDDFMMARPAEDRRAIEAHQFKGKSGHVLLSKGEALEAIVAVDDRDDLTPWCLADAAAKLPAGTYRVVDDDGGDALLGWLLSQHRFDDFKSKKDDDDDRRPRILLTAEPARIDRIVRLAEATALVRDLVDTPAGDLGPAELEQQVRALARDFGGDVSVVSGPDLDDGYPLIAAVGRAASEDRAPRLIELEWGRKQDPRIAVIGKGVCFDSGGLDIKPGSGMRLMKKDMGGAAHAIALARLIMGERLPVRLHLLIPAVENAIAGNAYRPGDVIRSRKGLMVEIDNTDAEGRLILADALVKAAEGEPERMVDFATLTGAARVALGPDLPAFFANDDAWADAMLDAAKAVDDPIWRMPLWGPYDKMLKSDLADLVNSAASPMAGCITAAMFLKRFVPDTLPWGHFDTYAWRDSALPGRPKGGEALGLRAAFGAIAALHPHR